MFFLKFLFKLIQKGGIMNPIAQYVSNQQAVYRRPTIFLGCIGKVEKFARQQIETRVTSAVFGVTLAINVVADRSKNALEEVVAGVTGLEGYRFKNAFYHIGAGIAYPVTLLGLGAIGLISPVHGGRAANKAQTLFNDSKLNQREAVRVASFSAVVLSPVRGVTSFISSIVHCVTNLIQTPFKDDSKASIIDSFETLEKGVKRLVMCIPCMFSKDARIKHLGLVS